ncbi:glycosyltransferase family 39 protein [Pontibacter sp. G13]|uniref:ArnT family glycosyltransferase n=1 Tax=Pontibacter sp. G13 TaxID=3074898 RepID=UPI002889F753|nr:glycosyltransferase family 39 protein [Pontibacter sp. G13]WNJ17113.1 glycosyltransferase family 39 protein [Pontibacter sp. G13]
MRHPQRVRVLFYLSWCLGLMVQAYWTELTSDEAYYWMYSRELAWGYFDHPPMIALLVNVGYAIIPNQLGVRLLPILLSTCTIFLWERMVQPNHPETFFKIVVSVGILHFIGFFAIPDAPLLFTASLFLLTYQAYLRQPDTQRAVLLGIIAAVMCLSKYHGLIIIGLVLLSNFKLLLRKEVWLGIGVAFLLLLPHLWWQVEASFPSMQYHLFERSNRPYELNFTMDYVWSQLLVLGPLTGILFFVASAKKVPDDLFERALYFLFWGGYLFFFFMTFKGRVEGHWTLFVVIPAVYFAYQWVEARPQFHRPMNYIFGISIVLILITRGLSAAGYPSDESAFLFSATKRFQHQDQMEAIYEVAGDLPVAFVNSYQLASLYSFYTPGEGFSLNNIEGRRNQFDIWQSDQRYLNQEVMVIHEFGVPSLPYLRGVRKPFQYAIIPHFQSFSPIQIDVLALPKQAPTRNKFSVQILITLPESSTWDFSPQSEFPPYLCYYFYYQTRRVRKMDLIRITPDLIGQPIWVDLESPSFSGAFQLQMAIQPGWLTPTANSRLYPIDFQSGP